MDSELRDLSQQSLTYSFVNNLQGMMFYIPHWIWKNWEEGRMRMISEGLRGVITMPQDERRARQNRIVRYLVDSMSTHNTYAFGYFFCEFLNVVNVVS